MLSLRRSLLCLLSPLCSLALPLRLLLSVFLLLFSRPLRLDGVFSYLSIFRMSWHRTSETQRHKQH
jgi:hypothetical protein